jgi:large subunit ribosomal protein L21
MDKYAVIRVLGRQYKVSEGQEFLVDKLSGKPEAEVLLLVNGENTEVGKPTLDKVKIVLKVIAEEVKGVKIDVFKYKSKSRFRKHVGFRPKYTKLLVEKIG